MSRRTIRTLLLVVTTLLIGLIAACTDDASAQRQDVRPPLPSPYNVTATVGMVGDIVQSLAGDKARVSNLMGPGVDPHLYTPTRSDVNQLSQSDAIFYSGLLLEGRMIDVLVKLGRNRPVFAVTELIVDDYLIETTGGHHDPHVWMDVQGWMKATEAAANSLAELDPDNESLYRQNAAAYLEQLAGLDAYAREHFATIPEGQRVMITAHDAFSYMGRAYGLEVLGIQGLSTESEAGIQDINRLVDLLVERRVPAVFVESSVSDKNVRALIEGARSRGHQVRIGGTLFSDAMGKPGTYEGTYLGMIDHNVTTIVNALGGTAPERGWQGRLGGRQ